jgi:hypothetical protein
LVGNALSVASETCTNGDIYGYVSWIPSSITSIAIAEIAASPAKFEPAVGDLSETVQISVLGIRGGSYSNVNITADCTYTKASGDADITVSVGGLITVAGTAIVGDSAIIDVEYGSLIDTVLVEVVA